jgi:alkanesulfonate monooxygenase SsuD/methylene tetrahydromethanopterin reductase-like flavin-dependent oxidoreductase (luciferase family)
MKVFFFHLMPWPYLPDDFDEKYDSAWVWCPNSLFDPVKGHELYNEYINSLVLAEELGFDGVCVNEHHQNAYGLMPSPNLIAGMLAMRTKTMKIAIIGNALPMYNPPIRVSEEWAMLDVISGGRIIVGMVIGGGPEYFSYHVDPTFAREKFREAHDLIIQSWTREGPFEFHGKHYQLRYVNPWPRPLQKPHPPVWVPGAGSLETLDFIAQRKYSYMGIPFFHIDVFRRQFGLFREACERAGYTADNEQLGWAIPVYVAETDEQARRDFEPAMWYFKKNLLKGLDFIVPPGYTSEKSLVAILKNRGSFLYHQETWNDIEKGVFCIIGSPATVRDKINHYRKELGAGNLLTGCQVGTLTHEMTRNSMRLFSEQVMPYIRD